MTPPPVTLRAPEGEREKHFVCNSWTESQVKFCPAKVWFDEDGRPLRVERIQKGAFLDGHAKLVDKLLARAVTVTAAISPGLLAGWLCYEPGVCVHYAYTDRTFRRLGVARLLLAQVTETPRVVTHWTPPCETLFRGYQYDPTKAWV